MDCFKLNQTLTQTKVSKSDKNYKKICDSIEKLHFEDNLYDLDFNEIMKKNPQMVKENIFLSYHTLTMNDTVKNAYNLLGLKKILSICQNFNFCESILSNIMLCAKNEERKNFTKMIKHFEPNLNNFSIQDNLECITLISGDWKTSPTTPLIECFKKSNNKKEKEMFARHIFDKIFLPEVSAWDKTCLPDFDLYLNKSRKEKYFQLLDNCTFKVKNGFLTNGEDFIKMNSIIFCSLSKTDECILTLKEDQTIERHLPESAQSMLTSYFKEKSHFIELSSENSNSFLNKNHINCFSLYDNFVRINNNIDFDISEKNKNIVEETLINV